MSERPGSEPSSKTRPEGVPADSIALIRRAQAGDDGAYNELLGRFHGRVTGMVRARLGEGMRTVVESGDVVNDAMVQAIKSFDRFEMRGPGSLLHWFAAIVENRICSLARYHGARKRDRKREVPLRQPADTGESEPLQVRAGGPSPVSVVEQGEQRDHVSQCYSQLTEKQREVIRLRVTEGLPWEEIAQILGSNSADTVRLRYARALVQLKKAMAASEGGPDVRDPR